MTEEELGPEDYCPERGYIWGFCDCDSKEA